MTQDRKERGNVPNLRFPEFTGEWKALTIKDFGDIVTGNTPPTNDSDNYGYDHLWASPGDLGNTKYIVNTKKKLSKQGFDKTRKIEKGSILVTCIGSTIGKMGMASTVMSSNQQINAVVARKNYDSNFIYYAIYGRFPKYLSSIAEQTIPIISKSVFEKLDNFAPEYKEQKKIGCFLSLLDERIETQNKIIEQYKSLIKGIYTYLLGESNKYKRLGEFCQIKKGEQINRTELLKVGKYYVMNGGVAPSGFYCSFNTKKNTISVSEGGNSCGYVQYNDIPFWSGGHCYTLENLDKDINDRYLFHCLKVNELHIMALRIGSGLPNIQKKDLSLFCVPMPSLLSQKEIANVLDKIMIKISLEELAISAYQKQKNYLLQQMFI